MRNLSRMALKRGVWRGALMLWVGSLGLGGPCLGAQEMHDHGVPEKLGKVSFPVSCAPAVQEQFNRGVALLHSFAYAAANDTFHHVAEMDPRCAMAYWGMAMTDYHQLWEPALTPALVAAGQKAMAQAQGMSAGTERERQFIGALGLIYNNSAPQGAAMQDTAAVPYRTRAMKYEKAMGELARANGKDVEVQVFYALALIGNASPTDKTHARQKQAVAVLEPLYREYPDHPGIAHYLIHANDNAEMAQRGLAAARAYSGIAPSAPHALHMPSHIFTRLGLWDDSIASNLASKEAAARQGDTGEELHAMDYLVYAYLQRGRDGDAADVLAQLKRMPELNAGDFKVGYAATAMPIRYAVERGKWSDAAGIVALAGAPPQVTAIAVWARGLGLARGGHAAEAGAEVDRLGQLEGQLRGSGNEYWATQTGILKREVMAWSAEANGRAEEAVTLMRSAADEEDAVEKLPVTPGPIVPAREQLGSLLLEQKRAGAAMKEFQVALGNAPGRRGALEGVARAAEVATLGDDKREKQ